MGWCVLLGALLATLFAPAAFAQQWRRAEGTDFRYLTWNVARENFLTQQDAIARVLDVLEADVVLLDELPAPVTGASLQAFADRLGNGPWSVSLGTGGGDYQRVAVLARGPVQRQAAFDALGYPEAIRQRWLSGAGKLEPVLRRNLDLGIPTAGADVRMNDRALLVVGLDMQCCGNDPGAWEEERRRVEAQQIRTAVDATWTQQAAVIVSGDFNNVQGLRPLEIMAGDDRTPADRRLARAEAVRGDGRTDWTWDGRGTEFPSKALDHVLYSPRLEVLNATVFDTETLAEADRKAAGIDADLSKQCSDHRPIVVDFRWRPAALDAG